MSKCTILAHVRNSKGEIVESRLFKDLLHYTSNRELAKEYYAVGTNSEFLDRVRDKAEFDENGEITFNSLQDLTKMNLDRDKLLNTLNKDIKAGTYSYQEAVNRLQNFNRNNAMNKKFMATIKENNGLYELSVVPRTENNESDLYKTIQQRSLQDRLIYHLNKAGVSVKFLEEGSKEGGRYSTVNAEQTSDGLYQLIQIAKGKDVTSALAEEAGHFAVGALGEDSLVKRLLVTLTPDVQKSILGEEYDSKVLSNNSAREVAGTLVGKALENEVENRTPWQRLANRVASKAKRIFATIKGDDIMKASIEAKDIANKIAEGFMSPNFSGNINNALNTKETLYHAESSTNVKTYRAVVARLNKQVAELRNIAKDAFAENFRNILGQVESGRTTAVRNPGVFSDNVALEGIAEAVAAYIDMLGDSKEIDSLLKSVDFDNTANFLAHMADNGRKLRQVHSFLRNSVELEKLIQDTILIINGKDSLTGDIEHINLTTQNGVVTINLRSMLADLRAANLQLQGELYTKEFQFFSRFCEDILGSKYVRTTSRILFSKNGKFKVEIKEGGEIKISDRLTSLESDISFFERYLGSMSNNPDIIGQIADKATKRANKAADDLTNQCQDDLKILEQRLKNIGLKNTRELFEISERTNKLTGNIISPENFGDWENDYQEFKDAELEAFKAATSNLDAMTEFEKGVQWDMWFRPKAKQWHRLHSTFDNIQGRYVPNDTYHNDSYDSLMAKYPGLQGWYNDYMTLKTSLDERLPEGSTLAVRMPQFKGTFTSEVRNRNLYDSKTSALKHSLRTSFLENFCESSEDQDFGSLNTYNSEEEELFGNAIDYEKEKMHRLPLFGINKLKDMAELSTDLFHSTLAYASMANSYLAMSQIVDTLEVGSEVLNRRKVAGIESEGINKSNKSNAYNRYLKFLDKQVYGIGVKRHKFGPIVWEKLVNTFSGLAGKLFLGGNVIGGIVNTGTGFNEIFKEAASGEYYNLKDWANANKLYFSSFIDNWMDYGQETKSNRLSLFVRHFNATGDNKVNQKNWRTTNSRIYNMFGQSLFLPYKSGDHYMQLISYLALAHGTKLWDENGNKIDLYHSYEVVDNEDEHGNKGGKTFRQKGIMFKSASGKETYDLIQSIINKINNANISNSILGGAITLNQKEQDYMNKHNLSLANIENTLKTLEDNSRKLIWTDDDESSFMDKAREINNRLHGIYNNQDKVAFTQTWYGNAVLAMRGWALGMAERRFASNHYSVALGHNVEGSLVTFAKAIVNATTDRQGIGLTMRALLLPFGKNTAKAMLNAGFSANQFRNLKRNFFDGIFILSLLLLKAAFAKPPKDEEENNYCSAYSDNSSEDDVTTGLLYYFTNRLYREQSALNSPFGWYYESNSLLDTMPVGFSALADLVKLGYEYGGAQVSDEGNTDFYYQAGKEGRYEKGDPKWENHLIRMIPFLKNTYTFEHPYEASKSFEYGRNVKQK